MTGIGAGAAASVLAALMVVISVVRRLSDSVKRRETPSLGLSAAADDAAAREKALAAMIAVSVLLQSPERGGGVGAGVR